MQDSYHEFPSFEPTSKEAMPSKNVQDKFKQFAEILDLEGDEQRILFAKPEKLQITTIRKFSKTSVKLSKKNYNYLPGEQNVLKETFTLASGLIVSRDENEEECSISQKGEGNSMTELSYVLNRQTNKEKLVIIETFDTLGSQHFEYDSEGNLKNILISTAKYTDSDEGMICSLNDQRLEELRKEGSITIDRSDNSIRFTQNENSITVEHNNHEDEAPVRITSNIPSQVDIQHIFSSLGIDGLVNSSISEFINFDDKVWKNQNPNQVAGIKISSEFAPVS